MPGMTDIDNPPPTIPISARRSWGVTGSAIASGEFFLSARMRRIRFRARAVS